MTNFRDRSPLMCAVVGLASPIYMVNVYVNAACLVTNVLMGSCQVGGNCLSREHIVRVCARARVGIGAWICVRGCMSRTLSNRQTYTQTDTQIHGQEDRKPHRGMGTDKYTHIQTDRQADNPSGTKVTQRERER